MDPFRFALAFGPAAVYLAFLGLVNMRRRPLLTTGSRDLAALSVALAGFAIVGPIELFMPENAATLLGWLVWLPLVTLYGLAVLLVVFYQRPRLVLYNISAEELRPVLAQAVTSLDPQARWAGDNLVMPTVGVQLHVEPLAVMRNVSLVATGERQDLLGWQRLANALSAALRRSRGARNPHGVAFLTAGLVLFAVVYLRIVLNPQAVAERAAELLRL